MKYTLTDKEIADMLEHWNGTPANSYRGSSYGEAINRTLFQDMSADAADKIISDLKEDIPLLANLDSDALSVLSENIGPDKKQIYIAIGTVVIPIATSDTSNYLGDTYNAQAK